MAENVNLNKEVFNKRDYEKTINTSFTQLGVKTIQEQIDEQPTVQEFFDLYNELFYEINELGETNSHEYLIKTSTEYIAFDENNELIEALQKEIAQLREELLETQQQLSGNTTTPTPILTNNTTSVSSGTKWKGGINIL
jgi:hypothetical protein